MYEGLICWRMPTAHYHIVQRRTIDGGTVPLCGRFMRYTDRLIFQPAQDTEFWEAKLRLVCCTKCKRAREKTSGEW